MLYHLRDFMSSPLFLQIHIRCFSSTFLTSWPKLFFYIYLQGQNIVFCFKTLQCTSVCFILLLFVSGTVKLNVVMFPYLKPHDFWKLSSLSLKLWFLQVFIMSWILHSTEFFKLFKNVAIVHLLSNLTVYHKFTIVFQVPHGWRKFYFSHSLVSLPLLYFSALECNSFIKPIP